MKSGKVSIQERAKKGGVRRASPLKTNTIQSVTTVGDTVRSFEQHNKHDMQCN
jgi:hypothetical protein